MLKCPNISFFLSDSHVKYFGNRESDSNKNHFSYKKSLVSPGKSL